MSATPRIPLDIVCIIIDFTANDRTTLSQLALASRDCCAYANRYLWRKFSLTTANLMTPPSLEERCHALIRNKQRAGCVRQLSMAFRHSFDTYMSIATVGHADATDGLIVPLTEKTEREIERLFDLVAASVAACAPRLESLHIFGPFHLTDVGQALSRLVEKPAMYYDTLSSSFLCPVSIGNPDVANTRTPSFPSLTLVSTVLSYSHGIMPFFIHGCSEVRKWYINGIGAQKCMENIPRNLFPALEEFEGVSGNLKDVTRGRRVRRITITNSIYSADEAALQHLLDGLEASAAAVLELSITVCMGPAAGEDSADVRLMRRIAQVAPFLQSLELFSYGKYTEADNGPGPRHRFAQGLAVFRHLEEFHWWDRRGPFWGTAFAKRCFESSSALQRVTINMHKIQRRHTMGKELVSDM